MIRIFIGYDPRETVAYYTLCHSIMQNTDQPCSFTPLVRRQLPVNLTPDAKAATEFADTRFLVPYLCNYEGWAIFMDCDFLALDDINELYKLRDPRYDVMVRQHNHNPPNETKFLGAAQTRYSFKNWSSLMMFNNAACKRLTPEYVQSVPGLDLHQFRWISDLSSDIGALPEGWNHLVGWEEPNRHPHLIHWTEGGPYFDEYADTDYAEDWKIARKQINYAKQLRPRTNPSSD